jgi:Leucine-rich repeat (LRR) protein
LNGTCLKQFAKLNKLRSIDVGHNTIADENLKYFGDIPNLQYLDLGQNNLTDKGVKELASCKKLIMLSLSGNPKITDKSLETIATFKNLHFLKLQRTAITAGALLRLKNLPLTLIDMPNARCSESDMKKLRQTFPRAKIALPKIHKSVDADTDTLFAPLH